MQAAPISWYVDTSGDMSVAEMQSMLAAVDDITNYKAYWIMSLQDYPWLKSAEHLHRVNKYRKRHGQYKLQFTDNDLAELALVSR